MVFSGAGGVRRTLTETGNWHNLGGSEHLTVFTSFREPLQCVRSELLCTLQELSEGYGRWHKVVHLGLVGRHISSKMTS